MRKPTALLSLCIFLTVLGMIGLEGTAAAQTKRMADAVARDPIPIAAGTGLSQRTPVVRPSAVKDVLSWTIETVRPRGGVYSVAPSPDGKLLAVGGLDGAVRLFDLKTGEFLKALVGHDYYIYALAWSPDSSALASAGSFDATVRIWDVSSGQPLRAIRHPAYTGALAWSPKGDRLFVAGGNSGTALLWDVTSFQKEELDSIEFGKAVLATAWSPDGRTIAVGIADRAVMLLTATDFKKTALAGDPIGDGAALAWLPGSEGLAIASPKETRVWYAEPNKPARVLPTRSTGVTVSRDGKLIATMNAGIELWDAATGQSVRKIASGGSWLTWSGDGKALIAVSPSGVEVFEAPDGGKRFALDLHGTGPSVAWSPAGKVLLVGVGSKQITCIDPTTGKMIGTMKDGEAVLTSAAVSPGGKLVAVGGADGTVRVFELNGEKLVHKLPGHKAAITSVSWSETGASFATASADKTVRLWNATKGTEEKTVTDHSDAVYAAAWGPMLASGGKGHSVLLSSLTTGKLVKTVEAGHEVLSLAWSPDKKWLAAGTDLDEVHLINPTKGTIAATLERQGSPRTVTALAFAPQSQLLAAGRGNHTVQVWNIQTGTVVYDLKAFAPVQTVAWTGDGKALVASSADRCVRSWDPASGGLLGTLLVGPKHGATVISGDGHYRSLGDEETLVVVAQTPAGQVTLTPEEFSTKFKWKNQAARAKFPGP